MNLFLKPKMIHPICHQPRFNCSHILLLILCITLAQTTKAEDVQFLQQRANHAYNAMLKAQREAETTHKALESAKNIATTIRSELEQAEQEVAIAQKSADQANLTLKQATRDWEKESDLLAQEWLRSGRKK